MVELIFMQDELCLRFFYKFHYRLLSYTVYRPALPFCPVGQFIIPFLWDADSEDSGGCWFGFTQCFSFIAFNIAFPIYAIPFIIGIFSY